MRRPHLSATTEPLVLLVAAPVLLLLIPSQVVLAGPLASNGSPARLLAVLCLVSWILSKSRRAAPADLRHAAHTGPARTAVHVYWLASLLAFAVAHARPLTGVESAGATRAVAVTVAAVGLALLALDGLRTLRSIELVLTVTVLCAAVSALIGMVQFVTPFDYASLVKPPGFVLNAGAEDFTRSDFTRVNGTAAHPIEFAVVLGALAAPALHFAAHARGRMRLPMRAAAGVILMAVPMSVSRSGVLALSVSLGTLALVWSWRQRANAAALTVAGVFLFQAAVPGLLGTLRSLFLNADEDPSVTGRTDDYQIIYAMVGERPLLGQGGGTFRPEQYFFLDNQYLLTLVEGGGAGLAALVLVYVLGASAARGAVHRSADASFRSLAQSICSALLALGVAGLTYDSLSFQQATLLTFLLLGCAGALRAVAISREEPVRLPHERWLDDLRAGVRVGT